MKTSNDRRPMMTVDELCAFLGITRLRFQKLLAQGEAPEHIRMGFGKRAQLRFPEEAVEAWLEVRKRQAEVRQRELALKARQGRSAA